MRAKPELAVEIDWRPLRDEDIASVERLASSPDVARCSRIPHPYPPGEAQRYVAAALRGREQESAYHFAILDSAGEFVGAAGLTQVGVDGDKAELAFWIGRPFWRRGYGYAAAARTARFGFEDLRLASLASWALERNLASIRILRKLGFALHRAAQHEDAKFDASQRLCEFRRLRPFRPEPPFARVFRSS